MNKKITSYQLSFNAKNRTGIIRITFEGNSFLDISNLSGGDFTAVTQILQNEPVYYDTVNSWLFTEEEVIKNIII